MKKIRNLEKQIKKRVAALCFEIVAIFYSKMITKLDTLTKIIKSVSTKMSLGSSDQVMRIIKNSKGGIILHYEYKKLKVYRLCQQRVFLKRGKNLQRVERSCAELGQNSHEVFCYHKHVFGLKYGKVSDFTATLKFV